MQPTNAGRDDLEGIDLSHLDSDLLGADLLGLGADENVDAFSLARALGALALLASGAGVLYLPTSDWYRNQAGSSWVFFAACGSAIFWGFLSGRWLWRWAQRAAARYAASPRSPYKPPTQPPRPPSALRRWSLFLGAVGVATAIILATPEGGYLAGDRGYSSWWFLAAGGAIVVGVLAGRFIMLQSTRPGAQRAKAEPLVWPPWIKWVSLAFMLLLAAIAVFGSAIIPSADPESTRFGLGGVGFVVGILAAIWLAKRFDESEKKIRAKALERRRS